MNRIQWDREPVRELLLAIPATNGRPAAKVSKIILQGGRSRGMDVVEVDNGRLRYWLLPERGMGIWKMWLDDLEIGWQSPLAGPVSPAFVPLYDPSGLGWLDGFDELLCRCGLESNGAPEFDATGRLRYPLHGKVANLPANGLEIGYDEEHAAIHVTGTVDESRYHHQKLRLHSSATTVPGEVRLNILDRVANLSAMPAEFQLLYHINFGAPLLDAGSRIVAPVKTLVPRTETAAAAVDVWDRVEAPRSGFLEQVYFMELLGDESGMSRVMLRNAAGTRGVSLRFDLGQLPCFTLWKSTAALEDGYVVGLEPGTNFPNPRSYEAEQGRIGRLAGGTSREFGLQIDVLEGADQVAAAETAIAALQAAAVPAIQCRPLPGWSIDAAR